MILSLGSVNADFQLRVSRWPQPGETLPGAGFALLPGGKAANVACLARKLGVPARLFGRVGTDALAEVALRGPKEEGVEVDAVRRAEAAATGAAMIAVREDGEKTILLAGNANHDWSDADVAALEAAMERAPPGAVLVADLEVPGALVEQAAILARGRGCKVVLDPSPADAMSERLYELCDVLTPNAAEAGRLVGMELDGPEAAAAAAQRLHKRMKGAVAVKGQHGDCVLASASAVRRFKGVPSHAVDATGAGDAFAGALAVALFEQRSMEEAVLSAMAAAACAVERYGSQASYPGRGELEARTAALRQANAG